MSNTNDAPGHAYEGKSVLLVDDDIDYLAAMRVQLESAGFRVTSAESVEEATETLEGLHPDLAIVDLMLENTDGGFALCHHIKKAKPGVPVIMVSAVKHETGMDFDATTSEERSWIKADAWLAKPVRFEQLTREIDRVLGS